MDPRSPILGPRFAALVFAAAFIFVFVAIAFASAIAFAFAVASAIIVATVILVFGTGIGRVVSPVITAKAEFALVGTIRTGLGARVR